jgi:NTP pyrophosphatase (non-canonical NTP hydrolase)
MTKKDVLELKRRLKKDECTFTKLCGCYVNGEKNKILNLDETFLNLQEEEFYKYLEIAKKTLSGTVGNNILELEFPLDEEKTGGKQQFLMGLRESRLKNEGLLDSFYQLIIDNYDYAGNYLILVYHDAYDVMTKTSDNNKLDESEEVYEYLLCAICPVTLTKAGLGYLEMENRIGPRNRDWVVNAPDTGFVFPAFSDRSTNIHSVMYYTKDAKEPHKEFMEFVLGCPPKETATEQKNAFQNIINKAIPDEDKSSEVFMEIQDSLSQMKDEQALYKDIKKEPVILTTNSIEEVIESCELPEEISKKIKNSYVEKFGDTPPVVDHLLDSKILAASAQMKKEKALVEKVQQLQEKLEEVTSSNSDLPLDNDDTDFSYSEPETTDENSNIILRVNPQKVQEITYEIINGKKCIIIPMEENEHVDLNGVTAF